MEFLRRLDWWYWLVCIPAILLCVNFIVWGDDHGYWWMPAWLVFWLVLMSLFEVKPRHKIML